MIKLNKKNNKKILSTHKSRRGFTLLEALVAISILMVAVVAPITIAQKGLSSAVYSKNQMIASYLAQDAMEYVINIRDYASINSVDGGGNHNFDWSAAFDSNGYLSKCLTPDGCQIDTIVQGIQGDITNKDNLVVFPYSESNPDLLKKNDDGFYQYREGEDTNFTRQVKITLNPFYNNVYNNADEAMVNVIVKWSGDEKNKVDISTLIYNY